MILAILPTAIIKYPQYIYDYHVENKHEKAKHPKNSYIWQEASKYKSSHYRNKFIRNVRRQNLMINFPNSVEILKKFALQIERDLMNYDNYSLKCNFPYRQIINWFRKRKNADDLVDVELESTGQNDFSAWYLRFKQENPCGLAPWGGEFLEELYLLIEQIQQPSSSSPYRP